jgi:hypothetical protein
MGQWGFSQFVVLPQYYDTKNTNMGGVCRMPGKSTNAERAKTWENLGTDRIIMLKKDLD